MTATLYNKIGNGYNSTRRADPYIVSRLMALLEPAAGGSYLDVGCGTGNYTAALADLGLSMTGIDPSELMLAGARTGPGSITWMQGYAESLPVETESADGIIATLTIHHWSDHLRAFAEMDRVLKPGGRMVIFTFTPEQEAGYWFNHFFPQMMKKGMARSLSLQSLTSVAAEAGLGLVATEKYFVQDDLQDMFGYSGKNDPERYFDPAIVNGISYFSVYATAEERSAGFARLRESIDNNTFDTIRKQYENDLGDYLFVVLQKPAQ